MKKTSFISLAIIASLALGSLGCSVGAGARKLNTTHFNFPNSNVVPVGTVTGEASVTSFFMPETNMAPLEEQAIQKALQQKGGDILIDCTYLYKTTLIPIPIFNIYTTTLRVEGTACKVEIGKQKLN